MMSTSGKKKLQLYVVQTRGLCVSCLQGLEGEDEGAISMLSDNTAKLTSAVRYRAKRRTHSFSCQNSLLLIRDKDPV